MKFSIALFLVTILFSCSNKDEKLCSCLSEGEKLNKFSSSIMTKEINEADVKKLKDLQESKMKACKAYEMMSGKELLELKASCK